MRTTLVFNILFFASVLLIASSFSQENVQKSDFENKRLVLVDSLQKSESTENKIKFNYLLGSHLLKSDSLGKQYINRAIKMAITNEISMHQIGRMYHTLAMFARTTHPQEAVQYGKKSVFYHMLYNSKEEYAKAISNLAGDFASASQPDSAFFYYKKTLVLFDSLGLSGPNIYIGLAYTNLDVEGPPKLSVKYFKLALELSNPDHLVTIGSVHILLAEAYIRLNYLDSASMALDNFYKLNIPNKSFYVNRLYQESKKQEGVIKYEKGQLTEALNIFDSLYVKGTNTTPLYLSTILLKLSSISFMLGDLSSAEFYTKEAIVLNEAYNNQAFLRDILKIAYEIDRSKKDYKSAIENYERYIILKDSLNTITQEREYNKLIVNEATQHRNLENRLLKKEAEAQQATLDKKNIIILVTGIGLASLLTFLILGFIAFKKYKKQNIFLTQANQTVKEQADKLIALDHAKSTFFANISHDLRSPLTLILGALDRITEKDYEILDRDSRQLIDTGYKNTKRLVYLTDEIMELIKLEEGVIKPDLKFVKVVPYLNMLVKMFESAADIKSIDLNFQSTANEEITLKIDPSKFEKIIYNLLSNALKFTPNDGAITVDLQEKDEIIVMAISDNGPGIPTEKIDYIFERGYQVNQTDPQAHTGVGIGLAIVKEMVELLDGGIKVISSAKGTTFKLSFEKSTTRENEAIVPEQSMDFITKNSLWMDLQNDDGKRQISSLTNTDENAKAVMIVEDHRELRAYLTSILAPHYRIYEASNGQKALAILKKEKVDLIITDLMMPYIDGFELVDEMKSTKELSSIPILVLSARTDQTEKIQLISKGVDGVIYKPFDKNELVAQSKNLLERKVQSNPLEKLYISKADEFEKSIIAKLERLVISNIDNPHLSVLDLADEIAASESKVHRILKKIAGISPYEFIKEIRWQYLDDYLQKHQISSASKAAQLIGMKNSSYFISQYEKRFGRSIKGMLA